MAQIDILTGGDENLNFKPVAEDPLFDSLELTDEEKSQPNPFANLSASSAKSQVSDDLELTDSEKGLPNPFSKLPKANPKNPLQTAQEAYSIGQEQTGLDFAYRDLQLKQLYSGNKPDPEKLAQLKEASRQLQIRQYENQGNNFLTDTVYQTVQMLPPMITGAYEGVKEGGEMGLAGAAFGAAAGSTMGGVGAIPGAVIGGKAGFAVGAAKGGYDYWKGQGAGASFRELLENDVEPYAASQIAEIIGPAYAAVEYAQANSVVQVLGGKKIKSALLTGAMKVASKYLPKAVKAASSSVARGGAFVVGQSVQEGIQEAITATGTEIGKAEADLIREGASAEALDVLGKLTSESDPAKEVLGRGLLAFRESLGPMAVLGGTAKGVGAAGRGIKNIATGELRELTEKRQEIAQAGAPLTAAALANVEAGAPEIDAENIPGLEEDLEKAGIPIVSTEPQASEPKAKTAGLPGDELGAKIFSNIRSRKPIAKADLDQVGGFSLSSDWKLNEETGNFEYQGPRYEAKETKKIPVQEAGVAPASETEVAPAATPEAQAPETKVAAPVETIKPKPSKKGAKAVAPALETKTEQPKVAPVVAAPVTAPATSETKPLPKFEDIKKNQKQIKYLRKITSEINSQVPTEDQIQPKVGWKALDYYRALTDLYGKIEKLELPKPQQQAPLSENPPTTEENKATSKRKGKVRRLAKIFSIPDLSGDQISFRDQALRLAKKISQQVASEYPNLVDGADEIYGRLVERIAARIFSSRENNRPLLFNQKGEEMEADEENIGKYVYFSARRAALDALRTQEAKKEIPTDFSGPVVAEGSVTQPEAAKEEAKPSGVQVPQAKESAPEDSRAVAELRSAASVIRERSGPEVKLVIDWIIDTMIGADTELGKFKSYKELAEYLSKVLERPVSDKRVGQFVDKTIDQIAEILNEENIRVSPEKLKMLMTPEGKAARERKAAEEANKKQERELRQVLANLADRVRALDAGFSIKQTLIDFLPGTDTATRARITSEIIIPLEEGLIDDGQIATRLSNIQKGIENEKPRIRQPVPRSKPKLSEQTETSKVRGRARKSNDSELGGTSSNENVGGRAEPINAGDQGTSTRPSGSRSGVGEKQRETPSSISIDPRLTGTNQPKAVQAFVKAATSSGYPAKYILDENSGRPVAVLPDDVDENSTVPVIRVNPKYLAEAGRRIGVGKEFATYAFLAITEEVAHHNYLLLLAKEAKNLGISAQQHRKNETKRIAKIIKRRRGLKRKIEKLYNEGKPFTGVNADFRLVFEFMRMNTQNAMIGTITEALSVDVEAILREVEMGDRRFIFRFFDAIRDFLYTITGKTAAEQQFLKATADATARMSQRVSRSILRPNEAKPVSLNYNPPKKETLFEKTKPVKGEAKRAREEAEKERTGLSSASLPFLKEYAKELGIKVPLVKRKVPVFNEKTRKTEEKIYKLPFWEKAEYVKAIKEKLSELGKKPKLEDDTPTLGAALPSMRFKTEYAFRQIDQSFGSKKGIFKGLTVGSDNMLPWENLKAKILKGTSKAEAGWVLPTIEALVRNGRVDVDMAVEALRALAKGKVTVKKLEEPSKQELENQPPEIKAAIKLNRARDQIFHDAESQFQELVKAMDNANRLISLESYDTFSEDILIKPIFYDTPKPQMERLFQERLFVGDELVVDVEKIKELKNKLANSFASFAKELYNSGSTTYMSNFGRSQVTAINRAFYIANNLKDGDEQQKAFAKIGMYLSGGIDLSEIEQDPRASVRFGMVNPKPLGIAVRLSEATPDYQMQELREILVKTPIGDVAAGESHYEDQDIVGFGRMYTTKQGNKTGTFLFEAQTDAGGNRSESAYGPELPFTATQDDIEKILKGILATYGRSVYVNEIGNIMVSGGQFGPETIGKNEEGDTYMVRGDFARQILDKLDKRDSEILGKIKLNEKDPRSRKYVETKALEKEAAPLVEAYESLVLKNAIADAIERGHDFIAITDDETAAMTEGHSEVNNGMRAHYGIQKGSLHNLARKLTGDNGTSFNDGKSTYVYEEERNDRAEASLTPYRYKKEEVTGVAYSLDNVKALGDESDIYNILGASMPTDRPYWLKPDGGVQEVDEDAVREFTSVGGHADAALEWMRENDPKSEFLTTWSLLDPLERNDRQQLPLQEMFKRGWVRVVGDAFNLYIEGNPSQEQMTQLFETAINEEVNLIQDLSGLGGRAKSRVIYEVPEKDELGVAMPRRGFSTSEPKFSFDWRELPDNLEGLKEVETRAGTFDVRVYADEDGVKYIVKRGQSLEQFENEIAAERIYKLLNYPVAESKLITLENGEPAKIAEFVYGPTLGEFEKMMGPADSSIVEKVYEQIGDGLIIDAYLFNYDVLGQDLDNIIVGHEDVFEQDVIVTGEPAVKSHSVYRIDNGGTFDIRAQGLPKNPFFFDTFAKLQTRYPRMNLSMGQMLAQISDLVLNSDEILNSVPKRLQPIMAQRLQWMVDQFSALDTMPKNTGKTDAEVTEYFNGLAKAMEAVELTRDEGGRLINAATGLPSEIKVRDSRGGVIRSIPKSEFRYRLERTPQFKMWFGDWEKYPEGLGTSKILDESGEPEVQYHGTNYSNRLLSNTYKNNQGARDYQNPFWPMRAQTTSNTFRGQWTSTSRQFAENWAQANSRVEYDEQIVIPVYVKSTNPFDARNPDHIQKLKGYATAMGQGFSLNPAAVMALENGFTDWSLFEKVDKDFEYPEPISGEENVSESQKKAMYFGSPQYSTLEAIVNLGFDGLITTEIEGATTSDVRSVTVHLNALNEAMNAKNAGMNQDYWAGKEATIRQELELALAEYKSKAVVNVLSWRSDSIKSVMNSGKFQSVEQKNDFKPTQAAMAKASLVKKNGQTLWNEFEREGITFASYESPENLVTYSYMTANQLRTRNIGKEYVGKNLYYVGQRLAPGAKSTRGREDTDMLGASLPRRFGVRIKSKLVTEVYDKLKRLDYEPIPDAMTEAEAQGYLEKNGIRGSMDAALSDASPLQHGSRELLAQKIIVALNQAYAKDKDPRILEDLLAFTDKFLEQSSGIGRALRALSFWSNLTPEGMLMLYKKKSDETNREIRDRFNVFFDRVKAELSSLPAGTIDEVLNRMSGLLSKAQDAADESKKRVSEKNTMTFWEEFANQLGQSLVSNSEKQLEEAEAVAAQNAGIPFEQMTDGQKRGAKRLENAKTINQAAQEMSREIKRTFTALAKEQGRNIRDPRIVTDEAFASKTIQEQEQIHQEERENKQKQDFKSMLTRWPRALRSWETMSDAIRTKAANNPELAELFNSYLGLVLNSPFTMPQLKKYISLRGVKIEDLIRSHYEEGKLANNAYSLARELVQEAGLGADEEEVGGIEFEKRDEDMSKEEPSKRVPVVPLSERLTQAIALQIREIVEKESSAKLEKLLKRYADKTLEPSLLRFINRLVEFQALGLFSNSGAWNEFQRQEGLNKLKPEVTEKLMKIMLEANKLVGYRKDERISDALSLIASETQLNMYNFSKAWWYVSILSGFGTQAANILGNASNTMIMTFPLLMKALYRTGANRSANKAELGLMFRALQLSFMDAGNILATGRSGTRKSDPKFFGKAGTDFFEVAARNATGNTVGQKVIKISTTLASSIRRAMTTVDMAFYNFNKELFLFEAGLTQAYEAGLKGEKATAAALEYTFRNSQSLSAAKAQAEQEGYTIEAPLNSGKGAIERIKQNIRNSKKEAMQRIEQSIRIQEIVDANTEKDNPAISTAGEITGTQMTFNEEPTGLLGTMHRMIAGFSREHPLKSAVIVPFTRIVANVWNQGIDMTGWGVVRAQGLPKIFGKHLAGKFASQFEGTADERKTQQDLTFARGIMGLSAVMLSMLLDEIFCGNYEQFGFEFCINGQGPKESAQKELLKNRLGWKPNSIFVRLPNESGTYLSYTYSPAAIGLSAVGLWKDNQTYDYFNEKAPTDVALAMGHRMATIMFDMNFLSSLSDIFEMLNPSEPERALAKLKSFGSRIGSAIIMPNFFRDVDQLLVSPERTAREGIFQGAFVANTPFVRQFYGKTELDMLGDPVSMQFRPISFAKRSSLVETLIGKNALPSAPKKDKLFGVVKMTDEQYADFRLTRAEELGKMLNNNETIERLQSMTSGEAQLYMSAATQRANAIAKGKLIKNSPDILDQARTEKANKLK